MARNLFTCGGRSDDLSGLLAFYNLVSAVYTSAQARTHAGWMGPASRRQRRDTMKHPLNDEALDQLFREARTYNAWLDRPVSDELLHQLYDLMKWGPTSANLSPARILFLRTPEAKERLRPALMAGNVDKTMVAPVTAIVAYDELFYEQQPKLFPQNPGIRDYLVNSPDLAASHAFRNGSLQGGYFILAARSLGLDCGPMSGFDNAMVDEEFFPVPATLEEATDQIKPAGRVRSNFLCNLGYGDPAGLYPRNPRLEFDEACQLL
jgi:3-hydroxypropanoate dehydrogenase